MLIEDDCMKLLKIENCQGYYLVKDQEYAPVDKITKDDLLKLADFALEVEATYDVYDEEKLKNQAHQIVYKSLFAKLRALSKGREEFIDESKRIFLTEYEKYAAASETVN